ncbi:MAG TPA: glucosamine-6-phosphate deaminase [Opitutaceae bacterium]|nr:glucosamine-6-phosphate deaminase [Opitutaceae bacterium]
MKIRLYPDKIALGRAAAAHAATLIRQAIAERGMARILAATGQSQFEFLDALTQEPDIAWGEVEMFHLDEYVGLTLGHPASFRKYLLDRLINKVRVGRYHLLGAEHDPERTCREEGAALASAPIDVAFGGVGENGHLAFNDPPADFQTEKPYLIVRLDEACRRQQVGEGWFKTVADVPERAISISVRQLLKARAIICCVPDARKADALKRCLEGAVSPMAPASILRTHPEVTLYVDANSAARLSPAILKAGEIAVVRDEGGPLRNKARRDD